MSKLTNAAILAAFGGASVSVEENDVNININAEVEGEDNGEVAEVEEVVETDTSDTPEAAELDTQDAAEEVGETQDQIEDLDNTVEGLESIALTLASISQEGLEMSPAAARLLSNHVNQLVGRHGGLTAENIGVASVEDFEMAPVASIEASLEGVVETIKSGVKQMGEFLKKLWENILNFIKAMFSATERAEQKAKGLLKQADTAKVTAKEVKLPEIVGTEISANRVKKLHDLVDNVVTAKYAGVNTLLKDRELGNVEVAQVFDDLNKDLAGYKGKVFLGGIEITAGENGLAVKRTVQEGSTSVNAPSVAECKAILQANLALIATIREYDKAKGARKAVNEAMAKSLDGTSSDANALKRMAGARKAAQLWSKRIGYETKIMGMALSAVNAVNNVIAQALKAPKAD